MVLQRDRMLSDRRWDDDCFISAMFSATYNVSIGTIASIRRVVEWQAMGLFTLHGVMESWGTTSCTGLLAKYLRYV